VILDQPPEADDTFQLTSSDGSYTKTLGAGDAKPLVAGEKFLLFDGLKAKDIFTLTQKRSRASKREVFIGMPFKDMTKAGQRAPDAKNTYLTLPSQLPELLPDRRGTDRPVDPDLVEKAPLLVDLTVEDPEI
jgi:hypothetical protein